MDALDRLDAHRPKRLGRPPKYAPVLDALDRLDVAGATGGAGTRKPDPLRLMSKADRMALLRAGLNEGAAERQKARDEKRKQQRAYQALYRSGQIETRPYNRKQSHTSKDS